MIELAAGFQSVSEADWRAIAGADLPAWRSDDGLAVGPIYGRGTGPGILRDGAGRPWDVVVTIAGTAVSDLNQEIRAEIDGGATGVTLALESAVQNWAAILQGVDLANLKLRIDAVEETLALAGGLFRFLKTAGPPRDLTFVFDPIATLAAQGRLTQPFADIGVAAARVAEGMDKDGVRCRVLVADGRVWHNGGASEVEELAAVLSAAVQYLRMFEREGVALDRAAELVAVTLAADADQFMTIAKLRAWRLLHARLLEATGIAARPCHIHSETSWRMLSRLDPHTNILRTTSAVFAAGVGGTNSVTALPFDAALKSDDPFARRIARNSQTILIEEAGLARVADPGAGSGAIEGLTNALAEAAWNAFRAIEAEGGLLAAVLSGSLQRSIAATRDQRLNRVRRSEVQIVGANAFLDPSAAKTPAGAGTHPAPNAESTGIPAVKAEALQFIRLTEPVET